MAPPHLPERVFAAKSPALAVGSGRFAQPAHHVRHPCDQGEARAGVTLLRAAPLVSRPKLSLSCEVGGTRPAGGSGRCRGHDRSWQLPSAPEGPALPAFSPGHPEPLPAALGALVRSRADRSAT